MPLDTETPHHQQSLRLDPKGNRLEQGRLPLDERQIDPRQCNLNLDDNPKSGSGDTVVSLPCDLVIDPPCDSPQ